MPDFQSMIDAYRARMETLAKIFEQDGCVRATSARDPSYSILVTRNSDPTSAFRVTSFRNREPIGHREYGRLTGGGLQCDR